MLKHKRLQHKLLFDPTLSGYLDVGIWAPCYVDGVRFFCGFCQMHNSLHPLSKSKGWNETPNVRYKPETVFEES